MTTQGLVLGFDTTATHCAAALVRGDAVLASLAEDMARGQAERLLPLLEEVLSGAGLGWSDLDALAVGVGPGNFTGIRIGVATARGLALGLQVPAYGVSGFEARAALGLTGQAAHIPGPKGRAYALDDGRPVLIDSPTAPITSAQDLAGAVAKVGAARWPAASAPPSPLYVKPPDAAPARDAPPVILP